MTSSWASLGRQATAASPEHAQASSITRRIVKAVVECAHSGNPVRVLGLTGPPGIGETAVAAELIRALPEVGIPVIGLAPMDDFHMSNAVLATCRIADHKNAPDTFDVGGYVTLLGRVRHADDVVSAPDYRRDLHELIAASLPVEINGVVITEDNYLGLELSSWADVCGLINLLVLIDTPFEELTLRLIERHMSFGRDRADATHWIHMVDATNMALIDRTKGRADLVLPLQACCRALTSTCVFASNNSYASSTTSK